MEPADVLAPPSLTADFGYTEEHGIARTQARRFLQERCPMTEVRRLHDDPVGYDPAVWKELVELGWLGLVTPEALGGLGLDHLHLALLMDEMGRVLLPSPFLPTLLALRAIEVGGSAGQQAALLPPVLSGEVIATVALTEPSASFEPDALETRAVLRAGGYLLNGEKTHVLFAERAGLVLVPAALTDGSVALFAVPLPSAGVAVEPEVSIDATRRTARLKLRDVALGAEARLDGGLDALRAVHRLGWVALASEMAGGIESTLELTRRYAIERIQFGKPIGAFQAVKHPIVDMMVGCEWTRSAAFGAAAVLDQDPARAELFARMAKAIAGDVYRDAVEKGVQLHGGFGFTWDCDVHFHFKRALFSGATLGDARHHRRHLGEVLFDGGAGPARAAG